MKITVTTRTLNESRNVERFIKGYEWADSITVIDGGSTDDTVSKLSKYYPKVKIFRSPYREVVNGYFRNPDNPNIQFAIDKGLEEKPDFLILDDFDDWPNKTLRENARRIIESRDEPQINAFRLYMWGDDMYFPKMNNYFDINYTSIWGWYPNRMKIWTDPTKEHGTILGISEYNLKLPLPYCLLHHSWYPDTIQEKIDRYNAIGLPMDHPLNFAGTPEKIIEYMTE